MRYDIKIYEIENGQKVEKETIRNLNAIQAKTIIDFLVRKNIIHKSVKIEELFGL